MHMNTKSDEAKQLVQEHDLIYVYHNRIDTMGDDTTTEDKVIEASKEEIAFLIDVVKKIANMNGTNMIITADHGFIYQNEVLDESDFSDGKISGDIDMGTRRFVIGSNLEHNQNVFKLRARDLNIDSDKEILIPKRVSKVEETGFRQQICAWWSYFAGDGGSDTFRFQEKGGYCAESGCGYSE